MKQEAINHYKHGISHDIFSEPVISYAKLSIDALEKQIPKKVNVDYKNYSIPVSCPGCNSFLGYPYNRHKNFCPDCGQALDWSE